MRSTARETVVRLTGSSGAGSTGTIRGENHSDELEEDCQIQAYRPVPGVAGLRKRARANLLPSRWQPSPPSEYRGRLRCSMILPDQERRGENGVRTLPPVLLLSGRTNYFEEYLQNCAIGADVSALGRAIARNGL